MHTLKKFIQYYAPYKKVFFLDLICAAVISLVDLAFPQILRTLTKTLFTESSDVILRALIPITLVLLIMYMIQTGCKYYVSYQGHMMGAYMERDMRQQLFDHYERLSFSYYDQNNSGQMMSIGFIRHLRVCTSWAGELIYLIDQNYWIFCIFVSDQLETGNSSSGDCGNYAVFFLWTE